MEENKLYYVPDIESFHVGFRYEDFYREGKIHPDALYEQSKKANIIPMLYSEPCESWHKKELDWTVDTLSNIMYKIQKQLVRCKFLDKEDIIECGFELANNDAYQEPYEFSIMKNSSSIGEFYTDSSVHNANIYLADTFFMIKNISELKKLLKQLNIE